MDSRKSETSQDDFEIGDSLTSPRNIFLHFVDHEFLSLASLDKTFSERILERMRWAMIVALLIVDKHVYMPAAAYFESDYARYLFEIFPQFRQYGFLRLIGSGFSVGDFVEAKHSQYGKDQKRYPKYFDEKEILKLLNTDTNWQHRFASASQDIKTGWSQSVIMQDKRWIFLANRHNLASFGKLEKNLLAVPERLGHTAFIADYVLPLLQLPLRIPLDSREINAFITQQYNYSFLRELNAAWCLVDLPFADSRPVLGELRRHISFHKVLQLWGQLGIDRFLLNSNDSKLIRIRNTETWAEFLRKYCWPYLLPEDNKITEGILRRIYPKNDLNDPVENLDGVFKRIESLLESLESPQRSMDKFPTLMATTTEAFEADQLEYALEEQPWYTSQFPQTKEITQEQITVLRDEIDVVIITATDEELRAVIRLLEDYPRRRSVLRAFVGPETYYIGKFGAYRTVITKCRMGSIGEGSVILATVQAQDLWHPKAIIMIGIAFGKEPGKQKIGDVLVASQVIPYEQQRVGEQSVFRSPIPPSNTTLLNRFENAPTWHFARPDGKLCKLIVGPILSGEKLVDDPEFKVRLFQQFPHAIGGEMEGAGLCAASGRLGVAWILIKSICDWGDGKKHNRHQPLAAAAAASLVHHVLSQNTILNSIN